MKALWNRLVVLFGGIGLALLVGASIGALAMGFFFDLGEAYRVIRYFGYHILSILIATTVFVGIRLGLRMWKERRHPVRYDLLALACLLGLACVVFLSVPRAFAVMDDEGTLLNTALSIYEETEVFAAHQGYWVDGEFELVDGRLDKRPYLFAYLTSALHRVLGYSVENGFVLNFGLGLGALVVGWSLFRFRFSRTACFGGLLLWLALPIYVQSVRSSGFDLLNFTLLGLLGWAFVVHVERGWALSEKFLICVSLLLAYSRYEAAVAVFLVAVCVLCRRWRVGSEPFSWACKWFLVFSIWSLVPVVWLFRCTWARVDAFQTAERTEISVFSADYIVSHLQDACTYLFTFEVGTSGAQWLIYLGGAGLLAVLIRGFISARSGFARSGFSFWGITILLILLIVFSYYWSSFMDPLAQRMSLPVFWLFAMGAIYFLESCRKKGWVIVTSAYGLYGLVWIWGVPGIPAAIEASRGENPLARLQTWKMDWLEGANLDPETSIFIDPHPHVWTAMRYSAMTPSQLSGRMAQLELHHRWGTFQDIVFVDLQAIDEQGRSRSMTLLHDRFQFEGNDLATHTIEPTEKVTLRKVHSVKFSGDLLEVPAGSRESLLWQLP